MANMDPKRTPMAEASPEERRHTFNEVALGYTEAEAMTEATRVLTAAISRVSPVALLMLIYRSSFQK